MKNIIFYTLVIAGIFISGNVFSQTRYDEVVYLKNGTIIRGTIIEFIPDQSIKIRGKDGNEFFFRLDEIEKIRREPFNIEKITIKGKQIRQSGFCNTTDVVAGFGEASSNDMLYGVHNIAGYLFNPFFSMGAGVGIEKYHDDTYVPLFLDVHAYFSNSIVSPYFSVNFGKLFGDSKNKGGILILPSFGVKAYFNSKMAVDFNLGYRFQEFEYEYDWNSFSASYTRSDNLITFRTGITF